MIIRRLQNMALVLFAAQLRLQAYIIYGGGDFGFQGWSLDALQK